MMRSGIPIALAVALLCSGGCGSKPERYVAATVPVKGKITFKGKPLTEGEVTFQPTNDGRPAHGNIKPDGTYTLSTSKDGDGALAGVHRVGIVVVDKKLALPPKYRSPRTSQVEVEVVEGKTDYPIDLK